jgi:hypothetical protein
MIEKRPKKNLLLKSILGFPLHFTQLKCNLFFFRCNVITQGQMSSPLSLLLGSGPTPHFKISFYNSGRNLKAPSFSSNYATDLEDELSVPLRGFTSRGSKTSTPLAGSASKRARTNTSTPLTLIPSSVSAWEKKYQEFRIDRTCWPPCL